MEEVKETSILGKRHTPCENEKYSIIQTASQSTYISTKHLNKYLKKKENKSDN